MFSKKNKTSKKKDKKSSKKEKEEKKKQKRLEKEKLREMKKEKKKKDKKLKRKHNRMKSYQEYNIDEHLQPINFNPELRYSKSKNNENSNPNDKFLNSISKKKTIGLHLSANKLKKKKHLQSQSTPTMPGKEAIFEGVERDEYSYNSYKPPDIGTIKTRKDPKRSSKELSNNKSRNSGKYISDELSHNNRRKHKGTFSSNTTVNTNGYNNTPIDSQLTNNTNITRISHSHTTRSSYASHNSNSRSSYSTSATNISRSSISESLPSHSLNLIDTINHVSNHNINTITHMSNMNRSNSSPKKMIRGKYNNNNNNKKILNRRTSAILGQQLQLLQTQHNDMHNSISASSNLSSAASSGGGGTNSINLPLNTIITSQNKHKNKYKKEFKYRERNSGSSLSQVEMKSISTRVTNKEINMNNYHKPIVGKKYIRKSIDSYGNKLGTPTSPVTKKVKITGYGATNRLNNSNKPIGGGYGTDISDDNNINIPTHLRSYYAIQNDLEKLKLSIKKKSSRTQIDAINGRLHTLFFANERTNLPNLAAFQKFFIDRMSVKSVHKDLDWHICLIRPKIHSRLQDSQIDNIINCIADLLRKCIKKFNNKRGHLTSSSNTHRIGIGTYGGGKDLNQIQSAYILSNKPSSSVPPEFYRDSPGSKSVGDHLDIGIGGVSDIDNRSASPYASDTDEHSHSIRSMGDLLYNYDVMTPPASVQLKQDIKKNKKEKQKQKHKRLLSFANKNKNKKKNKKTKHLRNQESRPNMSMQEIVQLTGLPGMKKVKGSDHHNVDEPYPMELFHISDMDFVIVYYVKFLTKFERIICEFLSLYQQYQYISDDISSDIRLQLSLVGSNPRETYMESMLKAYNTMLFGRQSREHPWIKVQTDVRKSQKFGQDLIYMVKYMKSNDIDALHELMKQAPDLNTRDRESGQTVLEIALNKSQQQPSFAFIARYLALKQLLFNQKLQDENIISESLLTSNPMVTEILLHLNPTLSNQKCINLAYANNYRNLARYMLSLNIPSWHSQQLIKRWESACQIGDIVKLRSVLNKGFNIDYFSVITQKTALIICTQHGYKDCCEFLLKNNCNVNAKDIYQKTALHYAAINLNGELFRLILENRANWTLRDLNQKTPIKYVFEKIGFIPRHHKKNNNNDINKQNKLLTTPTRFRNGSSHNVDARNSLFSPTKHSHIKTDMYNKKTKFWQPKGYLVDDDNNNDDDDDDDDSWDEYGYLVNVIGDDDESDDDMDDEEISKIKYEDIDVQQVVKILDIACLAGIPLDSRLLLLSVQRDWPHVILVLCQNNCKNINVDITGRDGITPLMLSAREGKKSCLSALLQSSRPDLDLSDSADRTPIMHAAYRGESQCVERLLKAGASIDVETVDGTTLLMAACYGGLDEFAKYLIEKNQNQTDTNTNNECEYINAINENGFSALLFASSEGYQDTVSLLLNNSASINVISRGGLTPLMAGCSGGLHELVLYVLARINRSDMDINDENGWTALMHAVASGSEKCAAILLKAGANVITLGNDGYSLLSIAIMGNLIWMVRHILEQIYKTICNNNQNNNSEIKKIYNMFNSRENLNGFTCIHEASGIGANKCLSLLYEYNKKYLNLKNNIHNNNNYMILFNLPDLNGRTPIMIAALNGHLKCLQLLLKNCDQNSINKYDNEGNSVLIYAIESNNIIILKELINYKYKFNIKTINYAKNIAKQRNKYQMLKILNTKSKQPLNSSNSNSSSSSVSPSHSINSHSHSINSNSSHTPDDEYDKYD